MLNLPEFSACVGHFLDVKTETMCPVSMCQRSRPRVEFQDAGFAVAVALNGTQF
jgi:hypothetical protein